MKPILLSIDPSVRSMGWATVNLNNAQGNDWYDINNIDLWNYSLITMEPTKHIQYRWEQAVQQLRETFEVDGVVPTHFAAEWPMFFNSMKGRIAAQENYTVGLASMVGYIAAAFEFDSRHITLWTPAQWKGMTSKAVTRNRFLMYFGEGARSLARTASDDVIDAIMIARYWLTIYDRKKFRWQHKIEEIHNEIKI